MSDNNALIEAQNRTTHAVRAIGVFLLYSALSNLIGGVIAGVAYGAGLNSYEGVSSASGGIIFGLVVIAIGNVVALVAALRVLGLSLLPSDESNATEENTLRSTRVSKNSNTSVCSSCGALNAPDRKRCFQCDGLLS